MTDVERGQVVSTLNRRLFHRCMEIITRPFRRTTPHTVTDPDGYTRLVQYELAAYGADLEEQYDIAAISCTTCPQCLAKGKTLGQGCHHLRSSKLILRNISQVNEEFHNIYGRNPDWLEFLKAGKNYDLCGVDKPFWRSLPNFDICQVLSPDLLHGAHKMFFDHIHKWNLTRLGAHEYDTRLKVQVPMTGQRKWPNGVSKLKQLSGKDHQALERVHLALVANGPEPVDGGKWCKKLTQATRAIMECIYLAQYLVHSDWSLAVLEEAYKTFDSLKEVWIEKKCKLNVKGEVIDDFKIPKIHIIRHFAEHILAKGTADNYNTEIMEHLHIGMVKGPYDFTNHHDRWVDQIIRRLCRIEKMQCYAEFLKWLARKYSPQVTYYLIYHR
jgi:hypothetical protein